MFSDSSKAAQRSFQAGFDFHQSRRNRLDVSLSLRKRSRHERLQRKRRALGKPRSNTSNNDQNKENNPNSNNTNNNNNNKNKNNNNSNGNCKKEESPNVKNLGKYVPLIFSNDDKQRLDGVIMIRILLSQEREAPISQVVETGVIPRLISYIDPNENRNNDRLRHESLWCLTNIASGPTEFVEKIVTLGAIDAICKVLQCTGNSEVASQAIWALGNIVGDDPKYGQHLLKSNLMQFCTDAWKEFDTQIQKETAWVIWNLCRTNCKTISIANYSHREMVENKKHCLPLIADLIDINKHIYYTEGEVEENEILSKHPNAKPDNILYDLLWAISNLTDEESLPSELTGSFVNIIARNEEYDIVSKMIHILHKECKNFQNIINSTRRKINKNNKNKNNGPIHNMRRYLIEKTKNLKRLGQPCHRALGNLLTGDDDIAQVVLEAGYLDVAAIMIDYPIPAIRRETLWALSNITAGTDEQLLMIVNNDRLFARISEIALECGNYIVAREALWCVSNAISTGSNEVKQKAVNYGAMKILIRFLRKPFVRGQKEMLAALEGMDFLLSVYGTANEYKQNNNNDMNDNNNNSNGFLNNYDYVVEGFNKWADKMEELGGLDVLETIQADETTSNDIFEKAQEIVKKYWPNDDIIDGDGDDSKGGTYDASYFKPKQVNNMFVFGFGNNGGDRFGSNMNGNNRNNGNNSNNNNNNNNGNNNGNRTNLWSF